MMSEYSVFPERHPWHSLTDWLTLLCTGTLDRNLPLRIATCWFLKFCRKMTTFGRICWISIRGRIRGNCNNGLVSMNQTIDDNDLQSITNRPINPTYFCNKLLLGTSFFTLVFLSNRLVIVLNRTCLQNQIFFFQIQEQNLHTQFNSQTLKRFLECCLNR